MATFADKYRKNGGDGGTTSFASLYRKDASGNAPLGAARDEQMRLTKRKDEVQKKVAAAQAEAEKFTQQANRYGTAVNVLETIGKSFVRPAISLYQGITQPMRSAFNLSPASGTYNVPVLGPTETYQEQTGRVISGIRSQGGSLGRAAVATAGLAAQPAIDVLSTVYTPAKIALGFRGGRIIGAGLQGAKVGAPISGAQSLADSAVEGKNAKQAAIDAAKATLFGAGAGFGLGLLGGGVGEAASSFARFYRKGAAEVTEQAAKKVETKPVEKPPVKTSEKSEPKVNESERKVNTVNDDIKDQVSKERVEAATSKPGGGYGYTVDEKKKIYTEIVEPKIKAAGKLADDEVYAFRSGKIKDGDFVNTDIDKIWGYPVDKDFDVIKVKRSQLDPTGNADKDGIGYRLYKEQPTQEVPKVEAPKEKPVPPATKPSGFAERIKVESIKRGMDDVLPESAGYTPKVRAEQAKMSADVLNGDIDKAARIISGEDELPTGLNGPALAHAAEKYLLNAGNTEAATKIRNALVKSKFSTEISEAGSTLSMLSEGSGPMKIIRRIQKAREEVATKATKSKSVSAAKKVTKENVKKVLDKAKKVPTKETWASFIKDIACD